MLKPLSLRVAFKKDNKPKYQMPKSFMFANVLRCSDCGCQISGEIKKGRYIYYSCSGGKGECEQKHVYIREEAIEKQFIEALERISRPELDEFTLKQEFEYVANKLDLTVEELQEIFEGPNKSYKDYRNKQHIVNLGAVIMTKLGLEKRLFR